MTIAAAAGVPGDEMRNRYLDVTSVSKVFRPKESLGDQIATRVGLAKPKRPVQAVRDITLAVAKGETLGLVGESGCGKSTLGRMLAGIHAPSTGQVRLHGLPVMENGRKTTTRVQMVFQDPFASLDPRMRISEILSEGPVAHGLCSPAGAGDYARRWLERVGLDPAYGERRPHQFSGGQRQRIAIARALAMQPDLLICDEPVASLDVSIQAQIINLFLELRRDLGLTCVFISHDLSVVRHVSDRIAVMYLGRVVELAEARDIFERPRHPYTRALLDSVPRLNTEDGVLHGARPITGEIPSPLNPPPGCAFAPRCPLATEQCRRAAPPLLGGDDGRSVACYTPFP